MCEDEPKINWIGTGPVCRDCRRPVNVVIGMNMEDYARAALTVYDAFMSLTQSGKAGPRTVEYLRELSKKSGEMAGYLEQLGVGIPPKKPEIPLDSILRERDGSAKCPKCGSSQVRGLFGFGRVLGCIHPECENYYEE